MRQQDLKRNTSKERLWQTYLGNMSKQKVNTKERERAASTSTFKFSNPLKREPVCPDYALKAQKEFHIQDFAVYVM